MTTTKSWNELSTVLSEVLTTTLKKTEVDNVMKAWNEKKQQVNKLFTTRAEKKKRVVDPNAPKRARSGYLIFCAEKRDQVRKEVATTTDVTKRLGQLWGLLSKDEQGKYNKVAEVDKARYQKEMANYTPPETDGTTGTAKTKKERTGPKRPQSAYIFYSQDQRSRVKESNPTLSHTDVTRKLADQWNNLSDDQKKPYKAKQDVDNARYQQEKASGVVAPPKEKARTQTKVAEPVKSVPKKEETKTVAKAEKPSKKEKEKETKPEPKPVKSTERGKKEVAKPEPKSAKKDTTVKVKETAGYRLFCDEQRDDMEASHKGWNAKQVTEELGRKWSKLSGNDREQYELEAEADGSEVEMEDDD